MTKKQIENQEAILAMKKLIKKGDVIYTVLMNVSSSGMSRRFKVLHIYNKRVHDISYDVAKVLEWRAGKDGCVIVGGCGMDMAYHLVSTLSYALGYNTGTPDGVTNCYGLNHVHL